jgi:hypothetical protein
MNDMPSLEQSPGGPPFERRMQLFNTIISRNARRRRPACARRPEPRLIAQIVANMLCHALGYAAVNLNLSQPDLASCFLGYCKLVEKAQSRRLDS